MIVRTNNKFKNEDLDLGAVGNTTGGYVVSR